MGGNFFDSIWGAAKDVVGGVVKETEKIVSGVVGEGEKIVGGIGKVGDKVMNFADKQIDRAESVLTSPIIWLVVGAGGLIVLMVMMRK